MHKARHIKDEHLKDIDFRPRDVRSQNALQEFVSWYEDLAAAQIVDYSERRQGQLTMLSAVLWHLLPAADYKRLTKLRNRGDLTSAGSPV